MHQPSTVPFGLNLRHVPVLLTIVLGSSLSAAGQLSSNLQEVLRLSRSAEYRMAERPSGEWLDAGQSYLRAQKNPAGGRELIRYEPASGKREVWMSLDELTPPELGKPLAFVGYRISADGGTVLFTLNPRTVMIRKTVYDCWVADRSRKTWRRLGGKAASGLLHPKLSPDGRRVAYVMSNDLYVEDIQHGRIRRLTHGGSDLVLNGTSDWVYDEELDVHDGFQWSPDSRRIAYYQFDQQDVPEFTLINYTDALYPTLTRYPYPKAGQTNPAVRIGIVSADGGRTRWISTGADPRNSYIPRINWSPDSEELMLQLLNRRQNVNTFLLASRRTGQVREIFQDRDDAWIELNDSFRWLEHGNRFLLTSERDGWRHAYSISREGEARLITTGPFDVQAIVAVDESSGWLYYMASPDSATQTYLYRSPLDGSRGGERITPTTAPGSHSYTVSPNGHWAFHAWSRFDTPGSFELIALPEHRTVRVLQDHAALNRKAAPVLSNRIEFVRVDIGEGVTLDGWLIKPARLDPSRKYPVIVSVYGEPAGTTVHDSWGGPQMFVWAALADDGYLVASFDNRGTPAPKGRAWRKAIYGSVGPLASQDQAAALRALARQRPYVDLSRVGVYGWSGGGSMTLNLMFRSPELFKVGVAGAPVPDETLYDTIYQERYMGRPQDNPEGYRNGSPLHFAQNLQGKLLILHGTGDDNVHFQGTQRLLNKLIELNKPVSFMEYPNRSHGIGDPHVQTLTYGFFEEHLPAGPR